MASSVRCLRLNSQNIQAAPSDSKKFRIVNATRLCTTRRVIVRTWKGGRWHCPYGLGRNKSPDVASEHRDRSATQGDMGGGVF